MSSKKSSKGVFKTQVSDLMNKAKFNPQQKGVDKLVYDVGKADYYVIQAQMDMSKALDLIDHIRDARRDDPDSKNPETKELLESFEERLIAATRMVTMARATI